MGGFPPPPAYLGLTFRKARYGGNVFKPVLN